MLPCLQRTCKVDATVNNMLLTMAESVGRDKAQVYKVFMANLTYCGTGHTAITFEVCRILSDQLTNDPDRSVGVVILPNTGCMGAGTSASATTAAQRSVVSQLEDAGYQLEVREVSLIFDEESMYSKQRAIHHPAVIVFSKAKEADKECYRSEFAASKVYVRRVVSDIPVWPRDNFINPTKKTMMGETPKLSENAELKQHITGVGLYTKAPIWCWVCWFLLRAVCVTCSNAELATRCCRACGRA